MIENQRHFSEMKIPSPGAHSVQRGAQPPRAETHPARITTPTRWTTCSRGQAQQGYDISRVQFARHILWPYRRMTRVWTHQMRGAPVSHPLTHATIRGRGGTRSTPGLSDSNRSESGDLPCLFRIPCGDSVMLLVESKQVFLSGAGYGQKTIEFSFT